MMRFNFEHELDKLNNDLGEMGELVTVAIKDSLRALIDCDVELAERVIRGDQAVNEMEKSIERHCINLLLRQQPVASDLRLISSALKMITDLERIGDQAADIAEITLMYCDGKPAKQTFDTVERMGAATIEMVQKSLKAFREGDLALADEVIASDDFVDDGFDYVRNRVIKLVRAEEENTLDPSKLVDILMIAKYLERIGDHAQNVAEWVVFSITGQHDKAIHYDTKQ